MALPRVELSLPRRWVAAATFTLAATATALVSMQLHPTVANAGLTPAASSSTSSLSVVIGRTVEAPGTPVAADATPALPAPVLPAAKPVTRTPAGSTVSDVCGGPGWQAKRGQAALRSLRDNGRRSGVSVAFLGAKAGYLGLTYPVSRHVDVFVRSCGSESTALLRHVVSHEMGHAYDAAHMTAALRSAYLSMRGIPTDTPWFGCNYCSDFATPAGDFAEAYSQWQRGAHDSRTQLAPRPNATRLAAIAATFFSA